MTMIENEMIFETLNEKKYAPPSHIFGSTLFDSELEKAIKAIPQKLAFKIGEVAELADVKPYVLRYWESEFDQLNPQKSKKGQRVYLRRDVEHVLMIKKLLYRDRFSIEGARSALRKLQKENRQIKASGGTVDEMEQVKSALEDLSLHISSLKQLFA